MFELDQRAPLGACEREVVPCETAFLPFRGDFTFAFEKAFTLREVADKLGISLRQVQAHADDGSLVKVNLGRGSERGDWRVLDEDLDAFVRRRKSGLVPSAFVPPEAAPHRKPDPEPEGYAARRAVRLAARKG